MMEYKVLEMISKEVKNNKRAAMVVITNSSDSTPRGRGSIMAVFEDESTYGTIGGGNLEYLAIKHAKECIRTGEDRTLDFDLSDGGNTGMQCGGKASVFIKVFKPKHKLIIAGGGHIALNLEKLGNMLGFSVAIFDDREEFCNRERFPYADELIVGDIALKLKEYPIDKNCFVVIVTHGHKDDQDALREVINKDAQYVGMIGSSKKNKHIMNNLLNEGISKELLDKVYAPIGIDLGGETPECIAFSIMCEILAVKNSGSLRHMKEIGK